MKKNNLILLERLMADEKMSEDELDDYLLDTPEDGLLDYKHGLVLEDKKKAAAMIREYLSGFANSVGGILIIGVTEVEVDDKKTRKVTGCLAPGGRDLAEWASSCLTPIASQFSPPPRFQIIKHREGNVLVACAARAPNLIRCVVKSKPIYYFRIHDQTLEMPEHLLGDLFLGRRQQPHLEISQLVLSKIKVIIDPYHQSGMKRYQFDLSFRCENQNLAWGEEVRIGLVCFDRGSQSPIGSPLLSHIEISKCEDELLNKQNHFEHRQIKKINIFGPFDSVNLNEAVNLIVRYRFNNSITPYLWQAAIYVLSKESLPVWYQVNLRIDSELLTKFQTVDSLAVDDDLLQIKRLAGTGKRAVVGVTPLEQA